jgi:hypothetical protein
MVAALNRPDHYPATESFELKKGQAWLRIDIAECPDGWRFAISFSLRWTGQYFGISARSRPLRSRRSALLHAICEAREELRSNATTTNSGASIAGREEARKLAALCRWDSLTASAIAIDPPADSGDEEDEEPTAAPSPDDNWQNRDRAQDLVNTSVDDCKSSLPHIDDESVIRRALALAEERGHKTRVQIIQRELRRRGATSPL